MHIENGSAEIVTIGEHEFEEYEEDILVQEEVPEPPPTDLSDTAPVQGKLRCITSYFCYVHLRYKNLMKTTCIDITII